MLNISDLNSETKIPTLCDSKMAFISLRLLQNKKESSHCDLYLNFLLHKKTALLTEALKSTVLHPKMVAAQINLQKKNKNTILWQNLLEARRQQHISYLDPLRLYVFSQSELIHLVGVGNSIVPYNRVGQGQDLTSVARVC